LEGPLVVRGSTPKAEHSRDMDRGYRRMDDITKNVVVVEGCVQDICEFALAATQSGWVAKSELEREEDSVNAFQIEFHSHRGEKKRFMSS